jgi:hypothetical protein
MSETKMSFDRGEALLHLTFRNDGKGQSLFPHQSSDPKDAIKLPMLLYDAHRKYVLLGVERNSGRGKAFLCLLEGGAEKANFDSKGQLVPFSHLSKRLNGWNKLRMASGEHSKWDGCAVTTARVSKGGPGFSNTLPEELIRSWSHDTALNKRASFFLGYKRTQR